MPLFPKWFLQLGVWGLLPSFQDPAGSLHPLLPLASAPTWGALLFGSHCWAPSRQ